MAGIRVRNLQKNIKDKHLKIHFSKPENSGGRIEKIYYPLFNNDAVILFEDKKVIDNVLKIEHRIGNDVLEVQGLPEHKVFSTMSAKLDSEASVLVQVTPALMDDMKYGENIKITEERDQTLTLTGNWFQLEWAWHYIDCFMQQQEVIQHEISQQPQRYARQPMEMDHSDTDEKSSTAPSHRRSQRSSASPSEVNSDLRISIAQRSSREESQSGTRKKTMVFDNGQLERDKDEEIPSLSYREHGKENKFHDRRNPTPHYNEDDSDSNDEQSNRRSSPRDKMRSLRSNIDNAFPDSNPQNYSPRSRYQDDNKESLLGSGYQIPLESMQSTLYADGLRRSEDENSTFRDFSGLQSMSAQTATDKNYGKSVVDESSRWDFGCHENNTLSKSQSSVSASPNRNSVSSSSIKEPLGKSRKPSIDAVDHSLGLSKPRLPARSNDIPDRYTEDQLCQTFDIRGVKVTIYFGDLIKEETDAIVNASNEQLQHFGGIAGAILKARGQEMEEESKRYIRKNGNLKKTEVAATSGGGNIKSTHIIHAVGPMWFSEYSKDKFTIELTQTFLNCLEHADKKLWIKSIALPVISSGVNAAPLDTCVRCFLDAVLIFTHQGGDGLRLVDIRLVNNDAESTVTSIVLVKTLLDHGIDTLTADAKHFLNKCENDNRKMNLPRGRPEANFSKTYVKGTSSGYDSMTTSSSSDKWATPSRRRSSSLSRATDKNAQTGDIRRYDPAKGEFVSSESTKKTATTAGSSLVGKHRERSGSMNARPKKDSSHSLRNTITGATGERMAESLKHSTRHAPVSDSTRKATAPKIKSALLTSDKLKSFKTPSKRSEHASQRTSDDYGAYAHAGKSKGSYGLYTDTSEDDEEFGLKSLPADLHKHSYREKFLQSSAGKPEVCAICLDDVRDPKKLAKCNHKFCRACIERHFRSSKPSCPTCGALYGKLTGDQPRGGRMTHMTDRSRSLPGYEHEDGMIVINYIFPEGMQESCHPQPGQKYKGITRKAFLPNNVEGREILRLLKKAFDARLVFTIGDSRTSGDRGVLTWNDIHHKTSVGGGPTRYGYPDPGYLQRVKDELAVKGITSDK